MGPAVRRALVLVGALLIQVSLGAVYAWSAFTETLAMAVSQGGEFGFSATQTQLIFSACLVTFAAVMVPAGRLQADLGPRRVAALGGLLLGGGYLGASWFGHVFLGQLGWIGVVAGAGVGLAYGCPIAVGIRTFPERKGLITGVSVAGFGFGALLWVKLAGSWGGLVERLGVLGTFRVFGLVLLVAVVVGAALMVDPQAGEGRRSGAAGVDPVTSMPPHAALRTPQFRVLWAAFVVSSGAGLMVIGTIKLFGIDALTAGGMDAARASAAAGTAMGVYYAVANGLGRIVWGAVSEPLGRSRALALLCGLQALAFLAFYRLGAAESSFYLGAALVGFNFGGNFALFPALTADWFGSATVGRNYGVMFTAYGVGGVLGPLLGGVCRDLGTGRGAEAWLPAFIGAGVALLVVAAVVLRLTPPVAGVAGPSREGDR